MGYLSDIVSDARRNYRVASRDATFGQTSGASLKSIDNGLTDVGVHSASVSVEDSNVGVERRVPSPKVSHGEKQKPETLSPFRGENASTKATSNVHAAEFSQADAGSAYGKTAAPERIMDNAEGKPNRKSRHDGVSEEAPGPSSSTFHFAESDLKESINIQREARDNGDFTASPNQDGIHSGNVSVSKFSTRVMGKTEVVKETAQMVPASDSASTIPHGAAKGHEPGSVSPGSRITMPTTHQADSADETAGYQKELEIPSSPIPITPQAVPNYPYPPEPPEAHTHTATERPATQPQVVIGSIEVVIESAPIAQTSRPTSGFNREPGRYYMRRL